VLKRTSGPMKQNGKNCMMRNSGGDNIKTDLKERTEGGCRLVSFGVRKGTRCEYL
jgi:hypothetical protein